MAAKATARLHEPNGRKFTKHAVGADETAAGIALAKELLITSGVVEGVTTSMDAASLAGYPSKSDDYSDANFHLRLGTKNIESHFEQLSNSYKQVVGGVATGYVDITNADIIAWAGSAFPGAILVSGKYVR